MSKFLQLLGYLERAGTTELVVGSGRPIAAKVEGTYQSITNAAITVEQLQELIRTTPVASLIPTQDSNGTPEEIELAGKRYRIHAARRGADVLMKIERAPGQARAATAPVATAPVAKPTQRQTMRAGVNPATNQEVTPIPGRAAPPRAATAEPRAAPRAAPAQQGIAAIAAAIDFELEKSSTDLEFGGKPVADTYSSLASPGGGGLAARADAAPPEAAPPMVSAPPKPAFLRMGTQPVAQEAPEPRGSQLDLAATQAPSPAAAHLAATLPRGDFPALVAEARRLAASDMHVAAGQRPLMRVVGELLPFGETLDAATLEQMLMPMLTDEQRAEFERRGYADLAVDIPNEGRARANISRVRDGLKGSFRLIRREVPTLDDLGLPKELARVTNYHQGLIVIAGPNGHGKTTTLAALVDLINTNKPHHILTVEDPVELYHLPKQAVISQREVGRHTKSFASALKASLREDPDVIVIGELRDRETVEIALTAAETGHLVMATMSTPSAAKTIDRLIDMFPPDDQAQVRVSLAGALRFIVAQRLLPNATGDGVVAAVELLTGVLPVAALIRENKLYQLPNIQQRGRSLGMIRFDDSLVELVKAGRLSEEVALRYADSRKELQLVLNPPPPPPQPTPGAKPGIDNIKQKFGGLFGKKDQA